jgi:hypothetical protein
MTKKLAVALLLVGFGMAAGGSWFGANAQAVTAPAPVPLSSAIVGDWKGLAVTGGDAQHNFNTAELTMRFTAYGIAFVTRGPMKITGGPTQTVPISFKADYLVLGNSIIMSTHGDGQIVQMTGLVVTDDTFEGISFYTGFGSFVGHGISMRRQ